jgi:hypothetical protein
VDTGETPEEIIAVATVLTGFVVLLAAVGTAARRAEALSESARLESAAGELLASFLGDVALRRGRCLDGLQLDTLVLDRLSPSRSYLVTVDDVRGLRTWSYGGGLRGDFRTASAAACVDFGTAVHPARVSAAVGA